MKKYDKIELEIMVFDGKNGVDVICASNVLDIDNSYFGDNLSEPGLPSFVK